MPSYSNAQFKQSRIRWAFTDFSLPAVPNDLRGMPLPLLSFPCRGNPKGSASCGRELFQPVPYPQQASEFTVVATSGAPTPG